MNQIVAETQKHLKPNAMMLIIKPIKVDKDDISDCFINWNPGVSGSVIKYIMSCFYTSVMNVYLSN